MPAATTGGDSVAYVSGLSAAFKDIADQIIERMPLFLLYIIGVTFILLAMAFRSIVISGTAAITTIISAFVGFGVLTLVVQEGHLLGITGLDRTGPIETFVPPIAFAILFGLSMDYMVFLMSRIREEHVHGLRTAEAVEHGIAAIGRVVVAAAFIMGTVFAAFILSADRIPKEFGLLLAVAILTDALLVRMTLVPAFLTLLGEKSWYIPRWLDRLLPDITIEAPHEGESRRPVDVERPAERPIERAEESTGGGSDPAPPSVAVRATRWVAAALKDATTVSPSSRPSRSTDAVVTSPTSGPTWTRARFPIRTSDVMGARTWLSDESSGGSRAIEISQGYTATSTGPSASSTEKRTLPSSSVTSVSPPVPRARDAGEDVRAGEARDERVRRSGDELAGLPTWSSLPVDEDADAVGEHGGVLEVVRDEEDRQVEVVERAPELGADSRPRVRVERGHRLVEEEDVRVARERARQPDALALPAGELARVAPGRAR